MHLDSRICFGIIDMTIICVVVKLIDLCIILTQQYNTTNKQLAGTLTTYCKLFYATLPAEITQ